MPRTIYFHIFQILVQKKNKGYYFMFFPESLDGYSGSLRKKKRTIRMCFLLYDLLIYVIFFFFFVIDYID